MVTTLLNDGESARDNHVLACNITKYSPIKNKFTGRLSNKPFLIWLLTPPPHLKYVATLPCDLSSIDCFLILMFHEVVWQRTQDVVGLFIMTFLQIYREISGDKKLKIG